MTDFNKSVSNFLKENKDKTVSSSRDFKFDKELKYCIDNGLMVSKNSNNYIISKLGLKVVELGSLDKYLTRQKTRKIFKQILKIAPIALVVITTTIYIPKWNYFGNHEPSKEKTDSPDNHIIPLENDSLMFHKDSILND